MRFPQASDRVKEAPAQALRGIFAGIGQLLLITDKLKNKTRPGQRVPRARAPEPSETAPDTTQPANDTAAQAKHAARPANETAAEAKRAAQPATATAPPATAPPAPAAQAENTAPQAENTAPQVEDTAPQAAKLMPARDSGRTGNVRLLSSQEAGAASAAATAAAAAKVSDTAAAPATGAPLPNYDELSIASLRARMRNLDVAQLRQLTEYEKAHAARADVLAMFGRRIAKLEAGS
jgi:hypothetical protein